MFTVASSLKYVHLKTGTSGRNLSKAAEWNIKAILVPTVYRKWALGKGFLKECKLLPFKLP